MSLYGIMRTSTSGMAAQAGRLSMVADNIANVNTTGYKRASCEFSSLLISNCPTGSGYNSGSVVVDPRTAISEQGGLENTSSITDLAVRGDGYFVVADSIGTPYLTRAGSFQQNESGELVNAGGFKLMGYPLQNGAPTVAANGFSGLTPVTIGDMALTAKATTVAQFTANLPSNSTAVAAAALPSTNSATAQYTGKSSLITYDNLGNEVIVDLYFTKTATNTWEVASYNQADATAGAFPYSSGPLATATMTFDGTTGAVASSSPNSLSVPVPNGATTTIDLGNMSQLATNYVVLSASANGNPPSGVDLLEITKDGTLVATFGNGTRVPVYRIPLATVTSPNQMDSLSGNVFSPTKASGDVKIGDAETAGFGSILSSTLEQSNVDLATELTLMIDSQRGYAANSKVFQTGSELMDVLINLKR